MTDQLDRITTALADRYTIERELGAGGMATVYEAHDVRHDRQVAIKVLRPELAAAIGADRFVREITTTANLRHPHILPLYDSGSAGDFLFYVMPLIEGESLRDRLNRDKQLPLEEALKITREVADALSYAHARGVVHRDIKPENILLEAGHAVVADFGIATAAGHIDTTRLTETGLSLGTPLYMSPEQASGESDLDGRSDLYSLACVVYEMLGGQPPFTGPTAESVVHQHVAVEPPPITNLRPAVPADVVGVLQRALAKSPADRYSPIAQFGDALGHTSATGAMIRPDAIAPGRAASVGSRALVGVAAAAVAVAVFMFVRSSSDNTSSVGRSVAVLPFDNFSPDDDDAYFANGITEEITSQLSRLGGLRVVSRTAVTQALAAGMSLAEIGAALNVGALLEGSVRKAGDQVRITAQLIDAETSDHLWSQDFDREISDVFAIQSEVARAIVNALDAELTPADQELIDKEPTKDPVAYNLYLRNLELRGNRPEENRAAIELLKQAVSLDPDFGLAWSRLAWRYTWQVRMGDEAALDSALSLALHALEVDATLPQAHYSLGSVYETAGRVTDMLAQFDRALDLDPEFGSALHDASFALAEVGEGARALELVSKALLQNPNVPNTRFHVAIPLLHLRNDERTEAWLRLADAEGMVGPRIDISWIFLDVARGRDDAAVERIRLGLARWAGQQEFEGIASDALLFMGDLDGARPVLENRTRLTPDARAYGLTERSFRTNYAFLLHQLGERDRADALFDEALAARYRDIERGNEWSKVRSEIAAIHAVRGNLDEALTWVERAYDARDRNYPLLARDPMFAAVRDDPRFTALLERMEADVAHERERVEAEGIAFVVDSMIAAGPNAR